MNIFFAKWNSFFSIQEFLFHKENFFSQTARCSPTPMSLGSSASFRRIVPSRDTSTTESEIPSFRDAKPHESWELVPLDELSLPGILQLRNRRFLVSGMQNRGNLVSGKGLLLHFEYNSTKVTKLPSVVYPHRG